MKKFRKDLKILDPSLNINDLNNECLEEIEEIKDIFISNCFSSIKKYIAEANISATERKEFSKRLSITEEMTLKYALASPEMIIKMILFLKNEHENADAFE